MRKFFYLNILFAFFINTAYAVDDCIAGEESNSIILVLTTHTVVFPEPKLCKPLPIADFTAIKPANSWNYTLDWSKQDHDLWHVGNYEVRVNGNDSNIVSYDYAQPLPVSLDLGTSEGILHQFEVRACSSVPSDDPLNPQAGCGDWQSTATQCADVCTDNNLAPPSISASTKISTTGRYDIRWSVSDFSSYDLQSLGNINWETIYSGHKRLKSFNHPFNGEHYFYRVRGCNGNICSSYSDIIGIEIKLTPTPDPIITEPASTNTINTTGSYTVSWSSSDYTLNYYIEEKIGSGPWLNDSIHSSITSKSFAHTNGTYYYRVKACNFDCSGYSEIKTITVNTDSNTTPDVPKNLTVPSNNTTGEYTVQWDPAANASSYELKQIINGQETFYTINETSKEFRNQISGTYDYQVRACNGPSNCSIYSTPPGQVVVVRPPSLSDDPAPNTAPAAEPGSARVGSMNGSFQTDQMGQANYSISILTGAATAGLAPQVALNYSSASDNGPLGVGWSISGTTIITRCRETEESRDGSTTITPQTISWDDNDKLCLNGERLFLATGTKYWDDLSTYRTERDQFARITYIDSSESFTIERKDGSIAYYGDTTDSNIQATDVTGSPTYAWAISRLVDNVNNYIDYSYIQFNDLEFVLSDIYYTGHIGSFAPYNNISFTYEDTRADKTVAYIAGAKASMNKRLKFIDSYIDGDNVRKYTLGYGISSSSSRSIVTSVSECIGSSCLPITKFDWSQPDLDFVTDHASGANFPITISSSKLGDINGDGRADLVFIDSATDIFKVAMAYGSAGFGIASNTTIDAPDTDETNNLWHLIDYNNDGLQDLMHQSGSNWVINLAQNTTIGFSSNSIGTGISSGANRDFQLVDMNGDGLSDMLYVDNNNKLFVRYFEKVADSYKFSDTMIEVDLPIHFNDVEGVNDTTDPKAYFNGLIYDFHQGHELNIRAHDVNGDGVADLMLLVHALQTDDPLRQNNPLQSYLFHNSSDNLAPPPETTIYSNDWVAFINNGVNNGKLDFLSNHYIEIAGVDTTIESKKIRYVDVNADGLTDVLSSLGDTWRFRLATGDGFTPNVIIGDFTNSDHLDHLQLFDYTGDGFIDMIYPSNDVDQTYVIRPWLGNMFSNTSIAIDAKAKDVDTNLNLFLDFNGDGREDHLRIDSTAHQQLYIRKKNYQAIDRIVEITNGPDDSNGMGTSTKIEYKPLTFSTTYNKGSGAIDLDYGNGSPVFDYLSSLYVVRSVTTDINVDETTKIQYQYLNARVQSGGRGFLGFGKIITSTPVRGADDASDKLLQTETVYRQDFPFIGMPASTKVTQYETSPEPSIDCTSTDTCFPPPCYFDPSRVLPCDFAEQRNGLTPTKLSETVNLMTSIDTVGESKFAYVYSTTEKTYSPIDESLLKTRVQTTGHDVFGNPTNNTVKIYTRTGETDVLLHTTTTVNDYDNLEDNWKIGLLRNTTTTLARPSQSNTSVLVEYEYDNNTGLLKEERRNPNDGPDKYLRVLHKYDVFGNEVKTISCSGEDFPVPQLGQPDTCLETGSLDIPDESNPTLIHRYNELVFDVIDAKGRYVKEIKNSLGHKISSIDSRDIYGNPTSITDLLGTTTTNTYNIFGEPETSYSSLGSWTYSSKKWCDINDVPSVISCPDNAKIRITNKSSDGSLSYTFIDKLGRTISSSQRSFNDNNTTGTDADERWIINEQYYDNLGRGVTNIGPYFYGEEDLSNIPQTSTEYDRYNRVTKVTLPDETTQSTSYVGFTTIKTNDLNQNKIETKNALGELIQSQDDLGSTLNYIYNPKGLVEEIKRTTNGNTELLIKNTYDKIGRKTQSSDVDTGTTTSEYNAEGEIIKVTDSLGQFVKYYRDELGRVDLTENFDGTEDHNKKLSTQLNYDTDTNQLTSEIEYRGPDAFTRTYSYDNYKRLSTVTTNFIDTESVCNNGGECEFTETIYYDEYSRVKIEQDASGKSIKNNYNNQGYLYKITNAEDESQEYYKISETDNRGNITKDFKAENLMSTYAFDKDRGFLTNINSLNQDYNYQYDTLGNLNKRSDVNNGLSECFYYDSNLNRLKNTSRHNNSGVDCSAPPTPFEQNNYFYDYKGNITQKDNQTYTYLNASESSIGNSPHQVQSKGGQIFTYDSNGNNKTMTNFASSIGTVTRNIDYTTFNKVDRLWLGNDPNNPSIETKYKYDTARQKFARIDTENGQTKVTYFIGNVEIEHNANTVKYKRQLGNYAIITESINTTTETYLFSDHLGSIDTITDASGNILQQMSFSAWGERRLPANWDKITIPTVRESLDDYTTRGFTGHEMVDAFGIINMGGRIYDAALGRVLQADPFVQDPTNTQSFNRYTYVYNNPLSYTDPSGYFSFRQGVGIIVGIVVGVAVPGSWGPYWAAFLGGAASGAVITGNLKGAIVSGLTALATSAIIGNYSKSFMDKGSLITEGITPTTSAKINPLITNTSNDIAIKTISEQTGSGVASVVGHEIIDGIDYAILSTNQATLGVPIVIEGTSISFSELIGNLAGSSISQLNEQLIQLDLDSLESGLEGYIHPDISTQNAFRSSFMMIQEARAMVARELANKLFIQSAFINTTNVVSLVTGAGSLVILARGILGKYSVGRYKDLAGMVAGLDAHHVGQKALMKRFIPGYDFKTAPSILVPKVGHTISHPTRGIVSRSTKGFTNGRQVLARDIRELRRVYVDIPNSALKKLIELNKKMYSILR